MPECCRAPVSVLMPCRRRRRSTVSVVMGLAGLASGEQPVGVLVGGGSEVEPLLDVLLEQSCEGLRDARRWVAESDADPAVLVEDVIGGQAQDAGQCCA